MIPRLQERYRKEIIPEMIKKFNYTSSMAVPRLEKIVINMGVSEGARDIKVLEKSMEELGKITGQKPMICRAKKAISNFKIRKGLPIACKVTLRKAIMYEFLDRMISVALPRIRDFKGFSTTSFDKGGSYSVGLTEQTIFPEIELDKIQRAQGMDITFVIKSGSQEESLELLKQFGFPFRRA